MSFLSTFFGKAVRAKGIPAITDFLVNNPMFRKAVIGMHNTKTSALSDLDSYLEKELMNNTGKKKGPTKRLDRSTNKTNR